MKTFLILAFILVSNFIASAQEDSLLLKKLSKQVVNCETIATNAHELIPNYTIDQQDSLQAVISLWKKYCSDREPLARLNILNSIYNKKNIDSIFIFYIEYYGFEYKTREYVSKQIYANERYEQNKHFFSYVPLNSKFDAWCKAVARLLIKNYPEGSSEYLACKLFGEGVDAFNREYSFEIYENNPIALYIQKKKDEQWYETITLNLSSGIWVPIGKLSEFAHPGFMFGMSFGSKLFQNIRIDFGINVAFLKSKEKFQIQTSNGIKPVNAKNCMSIGLMATKETAIAKYSFVDISTGIYFGRIDTDELKPRDGNDDEDSYYGVGALDLSLGAAFRQRVSDQSMLAINAGFHYAPYYKFDDDLKQEIGSQFATFMITYRFSF